jgi:hypothetical protein
MIVQQGVPGVNALSQVEIEPVVFNSVSLGSWGIDFFTGVDFF